MSNLIPGEIIPEQGEIELNLNKQVKTVTVSNSGDRPVQVGSHYHFYEANKALIFDREITLSPKEFKLLELFMKNPKRVWSRDLILEKIWEIDFIGDTKTVDVHVRWLREKLEENPSAPKFIKTVRGFGYRFG